MIQAMILAAGEGRRMRPLTLEKPKPLLSVAGRTLIEHQLARLVDAGIQRCIINVAYLGEQIRQALGDGRRYGIEIIYSVEPEPLETGGAINRALPLLEDSPFLLINADIWLDYPLRKLIARTDRLDDGHLILVKNPAHNPFGDFSLAAEGRLRPPLPATEPTYTFSGLSLLHPRLVQNYPQRRSKFPLIEVLKHSMSRGDLSGEVHDGIWMDIGTPQRLDELESYLLQTL